MAQNSKIEWCHHSINWWWGCTKKSEACANCYAETMDKMRGPLFDGGRVHWGPNAPRWVKTDSATAELTTISRRARKSRNRERIFVNSMSDTFEDHRDLPPAREILFAEIEKHPWLDFLLLTKRPENILQMVPVSWKTAWPGHVWIGTTVENQRWANTRIPELLKVPSAVRFLSCEPLLGPLNISEIRSPSGYEYFPLVGTFAPEPRIHWVICGGESGPGARPMHPDWARSLRDQCLAAKVPYLFKQWGEHTCRQIDANASYDHLDLFPVNGLLAYSGSPGDRWIMRDKPGTWEQVDELPQDAVELLQAGKKKAGRLLDGVEWNQFPNSDL